MEEDTETGRERVEEVETRRGTEERAETEETLKETTGGRMGEAGGGAPT